MELGKKVKHKTKKLVDSKHMLKGITLASFLESTIVPIPLEAVTVSYTHLTLPTKRIV